VAISGLDQSVAPYELTSLAARLTEEIRRRQAAGEQVMVNFTGGTKHMSIAPFQAARAAGAPALYVAMEHNQIILYELDGCERSEPIRARVSVADYLHAHGAELLQTTNALPSWMDAARYMANDAVAGLEVLPALASSVQKGYTPVASAGIAARSFANKLKEYGLIDVRRPAPQPLEVRVRGGDSDIARFLAGRWLEAYIAGSLIEHGGFDDVCMGVKICRRGVGGTIENELDVMATRNARLLVCSCKTGHRSWEEAGADSEAFYELAALSAREIFGIFCSKALLTNQVELRPAFLERARHDGVLVIGGRDLPGAARALHEHLTAGQSAAPHH